MPTSENLAHVRLTRALVLGMATWFSVVGALLMLDPARRGSRAIDENRDLAAWPTCTADAIRAGDCARGIDAYVGDHFPFRNEWLAMNDAFESTRGFGSADDVVFVPVRAEEARKMERTEEWVGDSLEADAGNLELGPMTPAPPALAGDDPLAGAAEDEPTLPVVAESAPVSVSKGLLIVGDRAIDVFDARPETARAFAGVVNEYHKTFPGLRVYAVVAPTAGSFYTPARYHSTAERDNLRVILANLAEELPRVDVYRELVKHVGEYVYFRTDHHWTARGAYYAYVAFCRAAGFDPVPLGSMERSLNPGFRGTHFIRTHARALEHRPDDVEVFVPPAKMTATLHLGLISGPSRPWQVAFPKRHDYDAFLGGDYPAVVVQTEASSGRKALLVKNSYGNAFTPFLVSHFDEVVVIDYRYYAGSVAEIVRERGITDIVLATVSSSANASAHRARLREIMTKAKKHAGG